MKQSHGAAVLMGVLLLASTLAQASVDPAPRTTPTQNLSGPITAFAVAGNGAVAAGMNDTGRTLGQPTTNAVWTWWDSSGASIRSDRADENNCGGSSITVTPLQPCIGDVTGIALSSEGSRIAIVARGDTSSDGRLLFFNSQSGPVANLELPAGESPTSVAMSADGTRIAVGILRPEGANPDLGRVRLYTWPAGSNAPGSTWAADTVFPVSKVAVGVDGKVTAIAQDRNYRFTTSGTLVTAFMHDTDATLNAVAVASGSAAHWSVAGAQDGGILLYSDAQDAANPVAAYDLQPGTSPQRAVTISADAKLLAVGDAAGIVRLLRNPDLVAGSAPIAQTVALDGAVHALQMSPDGTHLAIAAGRGTYLYRVSNSGLSEIWKSVGTSVVGYVGLSNDAEFVASASGSAITVFPARHAVSIQAPDGTPVQPGVASFIPLTLTNAGNRDELVPLTVAGPVDWAASFNATTVALQAGQSVVVHLNVTAPAFAAPGGAALQVTYRVRGIPTTTPVTVNVSHVHSWGLGIDGALSRGIDAGGSIEFTVRVDNLGNGADTTELAVAVDRAGWTASITPASITVAKGASATTKLTLTAPDNAQNGDGARATVTVPGDPSATLQVSATVGARFGVQVAVDPATATGGAGRASSFVVRITNTGNVADTFAAQANPVPTGWLLLVQDAALVSTIPAGGSVAVTVTVTPPAGAVTSVYEISLRVTSAGDASKSALARHELFVEPSSETSTKTKDKGLPGPGIPLMLGSLALLAWAAQRRRLR